MNAVDAASSAFLQGDSGFGVFLDSFHTMPDLLDAELLAGSSLADPPVVEGSRLPPPGQPIQQAPSRMEQPVAAGTGPRLQPQQQQQQQQPPTSAVEAEATTSASTAKRGRQQATEVIEDSAPQRASSRSGRQRKKPNAQPEQKANTQQAPPAAPQRGSRAQNDASTGPQPADQSANQQPARNPPAYSPRDAMDPLPRAYPVHSYSREPNPQMQPSISEPELKQAYCNSVQALKDYITVTNLLSYDILGKNLPDKLTTDLKMLIHQISKVCLQAIKPDTPYVINVISKDYTQATTVDWELDKGHWVNVIAHLQLTENQVIAVLRARSAHVDKLMGLYQERAVLARQAADLAAASCTQGNARLGVEDHSMLGILMRHGYLYCARNVITLHRGLELMKDSLVREQKVVMELFLKIVYQVLSPVQAALFVVESFPYHCDVLAMANVLSMMYASKLDSMTGPMGMGGDMGMYGGGTSSMGGMGSMHGDMGRGMHQKGSSYGGMHMPDGLQPRGDGLARLRTFLDTANQPSPTLGQQDSMMPGMHGLLKQGHGSQNGSLQNSGGRPAGGTPSLDGMQSMGGQPLQGMGVSGGRDMPGGLLGSQGMHNAVGGKLGNGMGLDTQGMGGDMLGGMMPWGNMSNGGRMGMPNMRPMSNGMGSNGQSMGGMGMRMAGNDGLGSMLPLDLNGLPDPGLLGQGMPPRVPLRMGNDGGMAGGPLMNSASMLSGMGGDGMGAGSGMNGNTSTPDGNSSGYPGMGSSPRGMSGRGQWPARGLTPPLQQSWMGQSPMNGMMDVNGGMRGPGSMGGMMDGMMGMRPLAQGNMGPQGQGSMGLQGQGNMGLQGQGNMGLQGQGNMNLQGQGNMNLQGQGNMGPQGQGSMGLQGQGSLRGLTDGGSMRQQGTGSMGGMMDGGSGKWPQGQGSMGGAPGMRAQGPGSVGGSQGAGSMAQQGKGSMGGAIDGADGAPGQGQSGMAPDDPAHLLRPMDSAQDSGLSRELASSLSRELGNGLSAELAQAYHAFNNGGRGQPGAPSPPQTGGLGVDSRASGGMDGRGGVTDMRAPGSDGHTAGGMDAQGMGAVLAPTRSVGGMDLRAAGGIDARGLSMEVRVPDMRAGASALGLPQTNVGKGSPFGGGDMAVQRAQLQLQQQQQLQQQGSSSPSMGQGSNAFGRPGPLASGSAQGQLSQLSNGTRASMGGVNGSPAAPMSIMPGGMMGDNGMMWQMNSHVNGPAMINGGPPMANGGPAMVSGGPAMINGNSRMGNSGLQGISVPPSGVPVPPPVTVQPSMNAGGQGAKGSQGSLPVIHVPKEPTHHVVTGALPSRPLAQQATKG